MTIGTLIGVKVSLATGLAKRPTFKESNDIYQKRESCELIHKSVDEKLNCVPDIKIKVTAIEVNLKLLLKKNNIEYADGDK